MKTNLSSQLKCTTNESCSVVIGPQFTQSRMLTLYSSDNPLRNLAIPEPHDEFDGRLLPKALFRTSLMLTMVMLVLQIYRLLATGLIFRLAGEEKKYWRALHEQCKATEMASPTLTPMDSSATSPNCGRMQIKVIETELKTTNWLERLFDPAFDKMRGKTTVLASDGSKNTAGGGGGGGFSFKTAASYQVAEMPLGASKVETDLRAINYLLNIKSAEHECTFCAIYEDLNLKQQKYWSQFIHFIGTLASLFALLRTFDQRLFYSLALVNFFISQLSSFSISLGKMHIYKTLTAEDTCGYQKVLKSIEGLVLLFNAIHFVTFVILVFFYFSRDEFLGSMLSEGLTVL